MKLNGRLGEMDRLRRRYQVWFVALAGGGAGAVWMPPTFYDPAAAEIIALVAALMAGILPTAILSATVLRAGGLSVRRILQARNALLQQMDVWAGLFAVAAVSAVLLAGGKLTKWSVVIPLDRLGGSAWNAVPLANGVLTGCLILLTLRAMTLFRGLRSLIVLSAEIAQSEALNREAPAFDAGLEAIDAMPQRKGFGRKIDLPHWPA